MKKTHYEEDWSNLFAQASRQQTLDPERSAAVMHHIQNSAQRASSKRTSSRFTKALALCAAFTLLCTGALHAAGIINLGSIVSYSKSNLLPADYNKIPSAQTLQEDLGYQPVLQENLGEYTYQSANLVDTVITDANTQAENTIKELAAIYRHDKDTIDLFIGPVITPIENSSSYTFVTSGGQRFGLYQYTNKMVPGNYQKSPEDEILESEGKLVFSYGAGQVEIVQQTGVVFNKDGICYNLHDTDGLSAQELLPLAEQLAAS